MTEHRIPTQDGGDFAAYVALPQTTPAPAIILLQEVYGVNRFMQKIADFWALEGFIAICPDLYWRIAPGIVLDPETEGHRDRALETRKQMEIDRAVEDVGAAIAYARSLDACSGKVGTSGYCLGGLLAYLTATRGDADCNVSYYGVGIEDYLDEADRIGKPLMLHIAEDDPYTPPEVRSRLSQVLGSHPEVTIHTYPGVGHAFAREGASADVPRAREQANARTRSLFGEALLDQARSPSPAISTENSR